MHTYRLITIMKTLLSLFIAAIWLSGVQSAEQLTQSDPAVIKPGDSHTLTCKPSGFTFSNHWMAWVREIGGKLQWLCSMYDLSNIHYHDDVKGRFTISRENSNNMLYLKMDNMKVEDSAVYYCAGTSYAYFDIWGPGTLVTVTAADPSAPSVFPMLSDCDTVSSLKKVTIGCLSTGYLPAPVDVTWNSGSITTGIKNLPDMLTNNGKFISASLLTISVSDWKSVKYTCNVKHMDSQVNRTIPELKSNQPTVEVLQSSCGLNGLVDLVCLISGFSPKDINITWLQAEKAISAVPSNNNQYMDSQGKFISSKLSVSKTDWDAGIIYTCKVNHRASSTIIEKNMRKCAEPSCFHPRIVLLPPSPKDLLITKEPKLTCVVSRLTSTETLNIKWKRSDNKNAQGETSKPDQNFEGTYTVNSTLKISLSDWEAKVSFTCKVEHSDLSSPAEKTIKDNREDPLEEPTIYVFPPAVGEYKDEFVGVICLFKGFSHKDIYVEWKKNNETIGEDMYKNTEPILTNDNKTYIMFSRVLVDKSHWNQGRTITCSGGLRKISSRDIKNRGKCP